MMDAIDTVGIVGLGVAGGFALAGLHGIPSARCVVGVDRRGAEAAATRQLEGKTVNWRARH